MPGYYYTNGPSGHLYSSTGQSGGYDGYDRRPRISGGHSGSYSSDYDGGHQSSYGYYDFGPSMHRSSRHQDGGSRHEAVHPFDMPLDEMMAAMGLDDGGPGISIRIVPDEYRRSRSPRRDNMSNPPFVDGLDSGYDVPKPRRTRSSREHRAHRGYAADDPFCTGYDSDCHEPPHRRTRPSGEDGPRGCAPETPFANVYDSDYHEPTRRRTRPSGEGRPRGHKSDNSFAHEYDSDNNEPPRRRKHRTRRCSFGDQPADSGPRYSHDSSYRSSNAPFDGPQGGMPFFDSFSSEYDPRGGMPYVDPRRGMPYPGPPPPYGPYGPYMPPPPNYAANPPFGIDPRVFEFFSQQYPGGPGGPGGPYGPGQGRSHRSHRSRRPQPPNAGPQLNPYEILGVDRSATPEEITSAYRRLSMRYHPDRVRNGTEKEKEDATTKMADINRCRDLLMDPKKREYYNASGRWPGGDFEA